MRNLLRSIDPRLPFDEIRTLAEEVDASLWAERLLAWLSAAFSAMAAAMAALAVFGALAYGVVQSKREIGIRMALGAPPVKLVRMLLAKPLTFAGIGAAAGVLALFAMAPAFGAVLYGISTTDPLPTACAAVAVLSTALAASLTGALGALRVNPGSSASRGVNALGFRSCFCRISGLKEVVDILLRDQCRPSVHEIREWGKWVLRPIGVEI